MKKRMILHAVILCFIFQITNAGARGNIPVYIEDSHAGSFYFFADNIDFKQKYTLLLFDYHSDATAVFNSDFIREKLKEYQFAPKSDLYKDWKKNGLIQCFNWIEPLMPSPVEKTIWISSDALSSEEYLKKKKEVSEQINAYQSIKKRSSGDLTKNFLLSDFLSIKGRKDFKNRVIVSIDLDYFTNMKDYKAEKKIAEIVDYAVSLKNLDAISFSISRPYLQSSQQADFLLLTLLKKICSAPNIKLHFEPFAENGPDRSLLAKEYAKQKKEVPYYNIEDADIRLQSVILQNKEKIIVSYQKDRWETLLSKWVNENFEDVSIALKGNYELFSNGYISVLKDEKILININGAEEYNEIKWYSVKPQKKSYNISGNDTFAKDSGQLILFEESEIRNFANKQSIVLNDLKSIFDSKTSLGTIRIFAEIIYDDHSYRTKTLCISKYLEKSYRGYLTEIFNLPYVFGGIVLNKNNMPAAQARYGTDCANFLIYGKRRQGYEIPYGHPGSFVKYLDELYRVKSLRKYGNIKNKSNVAKISRKQIDNGLILHFGKHVAAVFEDKKPYGILDENDLIVHQLEDFPEIIKLGKLPHSKRPFRVMQFKSRDEIAEINKR